MKFFRTTAPALVVIFFLLGVAPAFASEASDPADTYAPEAGEVLTDDDASHSLQDCYDTVLEDASFFTVVKTILEHSPMEGSIPAFLRDMFGEYTPKIVRTAIYIGGELQAESFEFAPGLAGVDFEWIFSVALFGVVMYCMFRFLGGIMR